MIDEMPPGRRLIKTRWVDGQRREQAYDFIAQARSTRARRRSSSARWSRSRTRSRPRPPSPSTSGLQAEIFPDCRLALLHGRMKPEEKDEIMAAFRRRRGRHPGLHHGGRGRHRRAERDGDAGRGRRPLRPVASCTSSAAAWAAASTSPTASCSPETRWARRCERLQVIEENHDGFQLAEEDLRAARPGRVLRHAPERRLDLRMARLSDMDTLALARREAEYVFADEPDPGPPRHTPTAPPTRSLLGAGEQRAGGITPRIRREPHGQAYRVRLVWGQVQPPGLAAALAAHGTALLRAVSRIGSGADQPEPSPVETYNDMDGELVNFFRVAARAEGDTDRGHRSDPFSREEFELAIADPGEGISDLERARRFYVRARQVRTGLGANGVAAAAGRTVSGVPAGPGWRARSRAGSARSRACP